MLCLLCVAFWFLLQSVSCYLAFCSRVLFSPLSIVITSLALGEERTCLCTSPAFVHFACIDFCPSLPLGVGGWLHFETVAVPGLFYCGLRLTFL